MYRSWIAATVVTIGLAGCSEGPSTATPKPAAARPANTGVGAATPEATTAAFLRAIFAGDAAAASERLTNAAAQRLTEEPEMLSSLGMELATLEVSESRLLSDSEAAVVCLATPAGGDPQEVCCLLKRDARGWGVCGMASDPSGTDPVVITFEPEVDPPQIVQDATQEAAEKTAGRPAGALR